MVGNAPAPKFQIIIISLLKLGGYGSVVDNWIIIFYTFRYAISIIVTPAGFSISVSLSFHRKGWLTAAAMTIVGCGHSKVKKIIKLAILNKFPYFSN